MALVTITVNNVTGSDTAASGSGPSTAVTGSVAAHTSGSASTTITLTNSPDLSGVVANHVLWLATASGRRFSRIVSADNSAKTVTVEDSFTIAAISAVDYAIGGKRASWHGDALTNNVNGKGGWTVEIEHTGTDYVSGAVTINVAATPTDGPFCVVGVGSQRPVLTGPGVNNGFITLNSGSLILRNLELVRSSNNQPVVVVTPSQSQIIDNCRIVQPFASSGISANQNSGATRITVLNCSIEGSGSGYGIHRVSGTNSYGGKVIGNYISGFAVGIGAPVWAGFTVSKNIIDDCGVGIEVGSTSAGNILIDGNTFIGSGASGTIGIDLQTNPQNSMIVNNIIDNFETGIKCSTDTTASGQSEVLFNDYNVINASTPYDLVSPGPNDVLAEPDFEDAASLDFSLQDTSPARGVGYPSGAIGLTTSTVSHVDIGAAQSGPTGGGGTTIIVVED